METQVRAIHDGEVQQPLDYRLQAEDGTRVARSCPVNSWNEWDPLEEVIVGTLEGATIPPNHISVSFSAKPKMRMLQSLVSGFPYPKVLRDVATRQLNEFVHILEAEGVKVRRPDPFSFHKKWSTPFWSSRGFTIACPRDGFMVIGDEILETPMSWRSRSFEGLCFQKLFREYFDQGARWTAAPKPALKDSLFDDNYRPPEPGAPVHHCINESELVFDAADFLRCGRDIFGHRSNVTNRAGFEWLRRHVSDRCHVHEIESRCRFPMHIDSSIVFLRPGTVVVNPDFLDVEKLPKILKSWDVIVAPTPDPVECDTPLEKYIIERATMCSRWISLNVLNLDAKRLIVERSQTRFMKLLKDRGFEPIPCRFTAYPPFGGAFHCATLDIRRRGELKSYF